MKHRILAIIIALLCGAGITLLLIPAMLSNTQLWALFFVSTGLIFIIVWIFIEFIIYRDLHKLKMLVKNLAKDTGSENVQAAKLKMSLIDEIGKELTKKYQYKNIELAAAIKRADLRRQFIADVSHEIKSPLFSAQGYVHTLLDGAVKDKEVRTKFLKKAVKNLDYLDILVQDLLVLSQMESDAVTMFFEHFDMVALARDVIEDRESKAKKVEIALSLEYKKGPLIVYGDYRRISQVLTNLVNNGINYNKAGGQVVIRVEHKDDNIIIMVEDTGVGIEPEYHDKIFNRFFRVDKSRTIKKSTGLGLAIVKHILERHNSSIMLESEPGEGSKFKFQLPINKVNPHEAEK